MVRALQSTAGLSPIPDTVAIGERWLINDAPWQVWTAGGCLPLGECSSDCYARKGQSIGVEGTLDCEQLRQVHQL